MASNRTGEAAVRGGPRTSIALVLGRWVPAAVLSLVVVTCFVGPAIANLPPAVGGDINVADRPMWSPQHLFGTDMVGNDLLARTLSGGRLSFEIALSSNAAGFVLGGLLGTCAGYLGGLLDRVTTMVLDVLISFPALVLAMVIAAGLGPSEPHVIMALAFFSVPAYARLARAATLKVRQERYVLAAELAGARPARVVLTHLVPNVAPQLLTFACLGLSVAIHLEAALSFLGLGVRPPTASWGTMIAQGQEYITSRPSLVVVPSVLLTLTLVSLTMLGDAGRRRLAER